jgi:uncharacterized protein
MPHTRRSVAGSFVGHHLLTNDVELATAFYRKLFDWTSRCRDAAGAGPLVLESGDQEVALIVGVTGRPSRWLPCMAVADLQSAPTVIERAGGTIEKTPGVSGGEAGAIAGTDPAGGRFVLCTGNRFTASRADAAAIGRFCWDELLTVTPANAPPFYEALAGWTHVEWAMGRDGRYWLFRHDGRDVAGMSDEVGDCEPGWVPYVQVVSAEETAAQAADLGAAIMVPPGDVPGRGRYAVLRDPTGAQFAVFALTAAA